MRRIDLHAHVLPPRYLEALAAGPGGPPLPPATREGLEASMARYGIDAAVISTGPPGALAAEQGRADELARIANEEIAAIVQDAPDRFGGLAVLPLPDVDSALAALAYALDDLSLDGVILFSNAGGIYLGDPRWDELFAELDRREAYVFLHPGFPPGGPPPLADQYPVWLYEFVFDTTRAVTNLIYSGTLERCPNMRMQVAHLGGTVPFLAHRLASLAAREPELAAAAPAGVLTYLSRLYYDTGLTNNLPALAATREVTDLDHVVFGTDWPYAAPEPDRDPAPGLSGLPAEERAAIDAGNAAALVPHLVGS